MVASRACEVTEDLAQKEASKKHLLCEDTPHKAN